MPPPGIDAPEALISLAQAAARLGLAHIADTALNYLQGTQLSLQRQVPDASSFCTSTPPYSALYEYGREVSSTCCKDCHTIQGATLIDALDYPRKSTFLHRKSCHKVLWRSWGRPAPARMLCRKRQSDLSRRPARRRQRRMICCCCALPASDAAALGLWTSCRFFHPSASCPNSSESSI